MAAQAGRSSRGAHTNSAPAMLRHRPAAQGRTTRRIGRRRLRTCRPPHGVAPGQGDGMRAGRGGAVDSSGEACVIPPIVADSMAGWSGPSPGRRRGFRRPTADHRRSPPRSLRCDHAPDRPRVFPPRGIAPRLSTASDRQRVPWATPRPRPRVRATASLSRAPLRALDTTRPAPTLLLPRGDALRATSIGHNWMRGRAVW